MEKRDPSCLLSFEHYKNIDSFFYKPDDLSQLEYSASFHKNMGKTIDEKSSEIGIVKKAEKSVEKIFNVVRNQKVRNANPASSQASSSSVQSSPI